MSILKFIESVCVQPAVHWSEPTPDGFGGVTYAKQEQIYVRWDDKTEKISDGKGNEIVSKAEILHTADISEGDMLYLGTEDEIGDTIPDKAYTVKRTDKTPLFRSKTEFVKKSYL